MITLDVYDRMMTEFNELTLRIAKLIDFMNGDTYKTLGATKQSLLTAQYGAMVSYSKILEIRIGVERSELEAAGVDLNVDMNEVNKAVKKITKKKVTKK